MFYNLSWNKDGLFLWLDWKCYFYMYFTIFTYYCILCSQERIIMILHNLMLLSCPSCESFHSFRSTQYDNSCNLNFWLVPQRYQTSELETSYDSRVVHPSGFYQTGQRQFLWVCQKYTMHECICEGLLKLVSYFPTICTVEMQKLL